MQVMIICIILRQTYIIIINSSKLLKCYYLFLIDNTFAFSLQYGLLWSNSNKRFSHHDVIIFHYYTSPEICLYKSDTLDWYVIPRYKMKNITYGYANERAGLIIHAQFVWIKSLRHINYAVAHAQCLRQHV